MNIIDRYFRRYPAYRRFRGLPEPVSVTMEQIIREALKIFNERGSMLESIDKRYPEDWKCQKTRAET